MLICMRRTSMIERRARNSETQRHIHSPGLRQRKRLLWPSSNSQFLQLHARTSLKIKRYRIIEVQTHMPTASMVSTIMSMVCPPYRRLKNLQKINIKTLILENWNSSWTRMNLNLRCSTKRSSTQKIRASIRAMSRWASKKCPEMEAKIWASGLLKEVAGSSSIKIIVGASRANCPTIWRLAMPKMEWLAGILSQIWARIKMNIRRSWKTNRTCKRDSKGFLLNISEKRLWKMSNGNRSWWRQFCSRRGTRNPARKSHNGIWWSLLIPETRIWSFLLQMMQIIIIEQEVEGAVEALAIWKAEPKMAMQSIPDPGHIRACRVRTATAVERETQWDTGRKATEVTEEIMN